MRAVAFVVAPWSMSFLFFGWRTWATWPSKQERERQREVSKLYDYHFEERRRRSYVNAESTPILGPPVQPFSIAGSARTTSRWRESHQREGRVYDRDKGGVTFADWRADNRGGSNPRRVAG